MDKKGIIISSVFGFFFVALSAFGAHALESILIANQKTSTYDTASLYLIIHTLVIFICSFHKTKLKYYHLSLWTWVIGIILFSGSLYTLSLTGINKLGMITPFGGVSFLIGWIFLIISGLKVKE